MNRREDTRKVLVIKAATVAEYTQTKNNFPEAELIGWGTTCYIKVKVDELNALSLRGMVSATEINQCFIPDDPLWRGRK